MSDRPQPAQQQPAQPQANRPDHPAARILFGWVEAKATPNALFIGVIVLAIILFAIDLRMARHEYLDFANTVFFYGFWGFAAFGLAVLSGWPLGRLLRRDEDYYGEADTQPADVEHPGSGDPSATDTQSQEPGA